MNEPPNKRCCVDNMDSLSGDDNGRHSIGPDGVFPSKDDTDGNGECCFFPSEDSLTVVTETVSNDEHNNGSDYSVSDDETTVTTDMDLGKELTKIGNILISTCCEKLCLRHLTAMDIIGCKREMAHCKSSMDRKKWLLAKLADNSSKSSKGVLQTRYYVAGKEICSSAWCHIFSVTRRTLQRMQQRIIDADHEHGNVGKKRQNTKIEGTIAWMLRYFDLVGDKMPDKDQIHLPCWENQKDIRIPPVLY